MEERLKTFNQYICESEGADVAKPSPDQETGFGVNIEEETVNNTNFRKVLYTTANNQLVVMSLKPGEDIGSEVHEDTAQFIRVDKGDGKAIIGGKEYPMKDGDCIIIPAGVEHNVINESDSEDLKIYTVYSPGVHEDGKIDENKPNEVNENIKHIGDQWIVTSKDGKQTLGVHPTRKAARKQLAAIEMSKNKGNK
jgi:mannose-6-phosphate isomerase-like protein (cupin superfamily)